jgi:hypothetical protein
MANGQDADADGDGDAALRQTKHMQLKGHEQLDV